MALKTNVYDLTTVNADLATVAPTLEASVHALMFINRTGAEVDAILTFHNHLEGTDVELPPIPIAANARYPWPKPINLAAGDILRAKAESNASLYAVVSVALLTATPIATGFTARGPWSDLATYLHNDLATYGGTTYLSLVDDNENQQPDITPTQWMLFVEPGEPGPVGPAPEITIGTVTSGPVASATLTPLTGDVYELDLVLPEGEPGPTGSPGVVQSVNGISQSAVTIDSASVGAVPLSGATRMTGPLKPVKSTTILAGLNWDNTGVAPTSPNNGDWWAHAAGWSARLAGVTYTLLTSASIAIVGASSLGGDLYLPGDITPTQIVVNTDNYDPSGLSGASVLRLSTDASRNLTGVLGGADGRILRIVNVGSFNLVLKNNDGASSAANRFFMGGDITLLPGAAMGLIYDSTSSLWCPLSYSPINPLLAANNLSDVASAATARANLAAVGTADEASTSQVWVGTVTGKFLSPANVYAAAASVSVAYGATITLDGDTGINFHSTLTGNFTLANPTNFKLSQSGRYRITQDATGGRTIGFGTAWDFPGGTPALSTAANAVDILTYFVHASGVIESWLSKAHA